MYGEGVRGMEQEPGFMVVKKNEVSESAEDEPITDLNVKEWEVGSRVSSSCYCCALLSHLSWIKYSPHYVLIHYRISNMLRFKSVLTCENMYFCVNLLSLCSTFCSPSLLCSCQAMFCILRVFVHFHVLLHILYLLMLIHFRAQFISYVTSFELCALDLLRNALPCTPAKVFCMFV